MVAVQDALVLVDICPEHPVVNLLLHHDSFKCDLLPKVHILNCPLTMTRAFLKPGKAMHCLSL